MSLANAACGGSDATTDEVLYNLNRRGIVLDEDKRRHLGRQLQELKAQWRKEAEVA